MGSNLSKAIKGRFAAASRRLIRGAHRSRSFDAVFYLRRYPDLAAVIDTAAGAEQHYLRHGRSEGRFGSASEADAADYRRYLAPSDEFDVRAYRLLNPDLATSFSEDRDYILHFIRHGRAENRRSTFASVDDGEQNAPWTHVLSVSQFSAWTSGWIPTPRTKADALKLFEKYGVERLIPISFDKIFEPVFYRQFYQTDDDRDDASLYREWLEKGLPDGKAPNEASLLRPYIGDLPYPECFNWQGYAVKRNFASTRGRAFAIVRLLEDEKTWAGVRDFLPGLGEEYVAAFAAFFLRRNLPKVADKVVDLWPESASAWQTGFDEIRGDVAAANRRPSDAKVAWVRAFDADNSKFSVLRKLFETELSAGNFDQARALLQKHQEYGRGDSRYSKLVHKLLENWFGSILTEGHDLLNRGEGMAEMTSAVIRDLAFLADAFLCLSVPPAKIKDIPDGPVVFLGNENIRQCTHYRIEQKEEQFARAGIEFRRYKEDDVDRFVENLIGARAAIFYRVPATPEIIRAILTARRMGIPTWYEIDDLLFSDSAYPGAIESYGDAISLNEYRGLQVGVPLFRFALSLCDRAIASTPSLLAHMTQIVRERNGFVLRNGLDSRNVRMITIADGMRDWMPERIRIFYGSGTLAHNRDFAELLAPALADIMEIRDDVDLVFAGHVPEVPCLAPFQDRIFRVPVVTDTQTYWSLLATCSISTAVLAAGTFEDCKSEIKWLEAAALGIPSVVSVTSTFQDIIHEGEDGLSACSIEEWRSNLLRLVDDRKYRHRLGDAAREKALREYGLDTGARLLGSVFSPQAVSAAIDHRLEGGVPNEKIRVLICNVFFDPQSIGGATRVVEGNVADVAAECVDIELAVFCSHREDGPAYRVSTSSFKDVPVFRVSLPDSESVERKIFEERILESFGKCLDEFRPHIVHFHCIQRLTASIVSECIKRSQKYVITIHDGWWISNNQFLVDDNGYLRQPGRDLLRMGHYERPDSDEARRRSLIPLLLGAASVTTVSESFASLCRRAGIDRIRVVENGLPDLRPGGGTPAWKGALRLSHIGGRSSHKGADLVEAAFRLGRYPNLSLTMIDGTLAPGAVAEAVWGESRVRIVAPFSQARVGELYDETDVLLAPSRWPESYGLVAREAASLGIWTVASKLGAIGEGIIEGENGFLIDTIDRADLDAVLELMNQNPDRFRHGSAVRPSRMRTAREQAMELADLYREIAGDATVRRRSHIAPGSDPNEGDVKDRLR